MFVNQASGKAEEQYNRRAGAIIFHSVPLSLDILFDESSHCNLSTYSHLTDLSTVMYLLFSDQIVE